jgi:hypothetical protein
MIIIHAIFTNNNEILFYFFHTRTSKTEFNSFQLEKINNNNNNTLILSPSHFNPCQKWSQKNVKKK